MTQTVFLRLDTLLARASKSGIILPPVILTLCSSERIEFACVNAEDVTGPISGDVVTFQVCVKKAPDDEESLLLLTDCPDNEAEGSASRRIAAWSDADMDNDELRAMLGGNFSVSGGEKTGPWMEVAITIDGATSRISFPITLRNALLRPETAGPNPRASTSWEWLKARLLVSGASISRAINDTLQTLTLSVSMAWSDISGKPSTFTPSAHTHAISDVTGLETALGGKAASSLIGANSGIAPLDSGGKVPAANLPSYVDDVIEAANVAALPGTGETGKIYVTLDTNKTYRWSGSAYVEVSGMPAFASQAEAEAGADNTKLMTPLRTAEAIAALASGASITDPYVAHLSSDGNDSTGDGSPTKPFLTAQAAVNAGYFVLRGGVGSFGNINITAPNTTIYLIGVGKNQTIFGDINMNTGSVIGNGVWMLQVARIIFTASNGSTGADGSYTGGPGSQGGDGSAGNGSVVGCYVANEITCSGGTGGAGGGGGPGDGFSTPSGSGGNGGFGGSGGYLSIVDCDYYGAYCRGGNGGNGGNAPSDGAGQGNGGNGGTGGQGGMLTIQRSNERSSHDTLAGTPGTGGAGGVNGSDGDPGGIGTTTIGPFSEAATGTDTTDTVIASVYNGTFSA